MIETAPVLSPEGSPWRVNRSENLSLLLSALGLGVQRADWVNV